MLPSFTEHGLLPPGVHRVSMEEFERRFIYFDRSDRRFRLFHQFRELHRQAKSCGIVQRILVGGSLVTSKPEPNDFDCILVVDPAVQNRNLLPMEYNLLSRSRARRIFGGDVIAVVAGSVNYHMYMDFFQHTREQVGVGVVEVEL
jgi:Family of unknown function (DUF6932)